MEIKKEAGGFQQIWNYLRSYVKEEFNLGSYFFAAVFLVIAIIYNYQVNFEKGILDSYQGTGLYFFLNLIYYAVPYLMGCVGIAIFQKKSDFFKKKGFWLVLFVFCFCLSFNSFYHWYNVLDLAPQLSYYAQKMVSKVVRCIVYLLPLYLYFLLIKKRKGGFFGLTTKGFKSSPYFIMMAIMIPLLLWASFNPDFLRSYPTSSVGMAERYLDVAPWMTFVPYEFLYALTFMALEVLFRGFLLFEMEKYLGPKVVLPMVCVYCTLHFGKPMMECISSIFGGFILGVIAIKTRSVYGGVWVHIFIAVAMDVLAFMQEEYWMKD